MTTLSSGPPDEPTVVPRPGIAADELSAAVEAKFEVLDVIGAGSSGVVYKVRHRELDQLRAVKVLTVDADDERIARLRREAAIATRLSHPAIVRVFDLELVDGALAIVMEYLDGEDLAARVNRGGPIPVTELVRMFRPVADALDRMHAAGVVHRDIKPANLFLCSDGSLKILDFSISRVQTEESELTRTGLMVGTPQYMAQELFRGETATPASDIYSFGAVLFFALTGRTPYEGETTAELLATLLHSSPPHAADVNAAVPDAASNALDRALAREPADRWPTAATLVEAMADEATLEYVPPTVVRKRRRRRRTTGWIAAASVLAVVALALLVPRLRSVVEHRDTPIEPTAAGTPDRRAERDVATPLTGGTLRMGLDAKLISLDPMMSKFERYWGVHYLLFDTLVDVDWTGDILPGLALRWEVTEESRRYVFHLRDDAVFHPDPCLPGPDHALDAHDVQHSLERVFRWIAEDDDNTWSFLPPVKGFDAFLAGTVDHAEGLRAVDDHTLEVTFTKPAPPFLHCLRRPLWSIVAAEALDAYGPDDMAFNAVGTGPYRLERADEESAVLLRHEGACHRDGQQRRMPYLDQVEVSTYRGGVAATTALREGRIDLIFRIAASDLARGFDIGDYNVTPLDGWEDVQAAGYLDEANRQLSVALFDRNTDTPFARDERIRRAAGVALRRSDLLTSQFIASDRPLTDGLLGYEPFTLADGDTTEASRLLAEAGYAGGEGLPTLTVCCMDPGLSRATSLVSQLAEVPIAAQISVVGYATWARSLQQGGCDLLLAQYDDLVVNDDPTELLVGLSSKVRLSDRRPEVAAVIEQIQGTADRSVRAGLAGKLARELTDDSMFLFIGYRSPTRPIFRSVAGPNVQGLTDPVTGWMNPRRARMHRLWLVPSRP